MYTYTFHMLRTELYVARIQTKFCQSCPHKKKGLGSLRGGLHGVSVQYLQIGHGCVL